MPASEPLAITGMACVFPGAPDLATFWRNVVSARVAPVTSLERRWGISRARYMGKPGAANRLTMDGAFAIDDDVFASAHDDRQVRLGHHVLGAALADAAGTGGALSHDGVGLVLATSWSAPGYFDHDAARALGRPVPRVPSYAPEEQLAAIARGTGGPRMAVDTACASSLYALDLAGALLQAGKARAIVVLGLNAFLTPFLYAGFSKLRALSPEQRILPFSRDASGIVPGEGAGAVVLERLDDARSRGAKLAGVLRALGLASDGAERGVFAPGAAGQRLAYERAYEEIDPGEIDYVEAHGTATPVGDATELESLDQFFGPHRAPGASLPVGSVKALVGHTLAAAGMASLLKALLMLRARTIPPHLATAPHPALASTRLALAPRAQAWPSTSGRPPRVGVSAFGFGGANAHAVVEAASDLRARARATRAEDPLAIVDFEAAFGDAIGADAWHRAVTRGEAVARDFPAHFTIDAAGLRMGPNLLRRIDPLQLLVTHLVGQLVLRHEELRSSSATAVVMTCNLGGAMSLRLSRALATSLAGGEADGTPEMTTEAIASSLPSMCSGYPAYQFDLRGFHETLAGAAGTFWTSLELAPRWLGTRCDALLLGAATLVKSDVDRDSAAKSGLRLGEGAAIFLMKRLSRAERDGDRVLAVVRAVVPVGRAATWEDACSALGLAPSSVDVHEVSELRPNDAATDACTPAGCGFLTEAAGIEALGRAIAGHGKHAVIEVREAGSLKMTVILEKRASLASTPAAPPAMPLEVTIERPSTRSPSPPAVADAPPALAWLASSESAVRSFFSAQRAALTLLDANDNACSAEHATAAPTVVAGFAPGARGHEASLVVDEAHPYFFDHPLDHVPGILLAQGILEVTERDAIARDSSAQPYVERLDLRFARFCEKATLARIHVEPEAPPAVAGRVTQGAQVVCAFSATVRDVRFVVARGDAPPAHDAARAEATLLHKRRPENVLVGPLERLADGTCAAALVSPRADHFFARGDPRFLSPLYAIEVARQILMLAAHEVIGVPLGVPMNLLSLTVDLRGPLRRGAARTLVLDATRVRRLEGMVLANVSIALLGPAGPHGEVRIRAQVVDARTYQRQRQVN